jgi:hypothetical protein
MKMSGEGRRCGGRKTSVTTRKGERPTLSSIRALHYDIGHDWMWTCTICKSYRSLGWLRLNEHFALHRIMCTEMCALKPHICSCSSKQRRDACEVRFQAAKAQVGVEGGSGINFWWFIQPNKAMLTRTTQIFPIKPIVIVRSQWAQVQLR